MQRFVVPQFIDVENKIIGPITVRQFLILLASFLIVAVAYRLLFFNAFLVVAVLILIFAAVLAFARINGAPFHFFLLNFIQTLAKPRLRVWNNRYQINASSVKTLVVDTGADVPVKRYQQSRLAELALIIDTKGRYRSEEPTDK
jgi:hypothetical protein